MNPKNYREFYKEIAEECNAHPDLVGDLVTYYYSKIRLALSELQHPKIYLPNLGTFSIRKNRLEKTIKRNKDILGNLEKRTYKGYDKYVPVKKKIELMDKLLNKLEEQIKTKKQFKDEHNKTT